MVIRRTKYDNEIDFIEEFLRVGIVGEGKILSEFTFDKLERVGRSGVHVYVVDLITDKKMAYQKYVIKIAESNQNLKGKIDKEKRNYDHLIKGRLFNVPEECLFHENKTYVGIAYPHMDKPLASKTFKTINLHDLFEIAFQSEDPMDYKPIKNIIDTIYTKTLEPWIAKPSKAMTSWEDQYKRYARINSATERIIKILKCDDQQEFILYNDRKFPNPMIVVNRLLGERRQFLTRIVHGDLHQRNILLYEKGQKQLPWLIDFEWTDEKKHYLIDYCLLECSIKFQYFTPMRTEQEIFSFEKALLNKRPTIDHNYSRIPELYKVISGIRSQAFTEYTKGMQAVDLPNSEEDWQQEYNKALILVTTGLMGIKNFEEIDKRGLICSLIFHTNNLESGSNKLNSIGEYRIVQEYINTEWKTNGYPQIVVDKGDDCSAFSLSDEKNVVIVSTDPTPLPVAWLLDDLDYEVFGWYSMLINLSDIASAGASPIGIQLSVEMPEDMPIVEFKKFLSGVRKCAEKFKCPIIGGNIKDGSRFVCTGTIFGEMRRENMLLRSGAKDGDYVAVIGKPGMFWAAVFDYKNKTHFHRGDFEELVRFPNPKLEEGIMISEHRLVTACMDSSDGIISCLYEIGRQSGVSIELDNERILEAIDGRVRDVCEEYKIKTENLALTWGDWQLVVTVDEQKLEEFETRLQRKAHIIGRVVKARNGTEVILLRDRKAFAVEDFGGKRFSEYSYFSNGLDVYKKYLKQDFTKEIKEYF